MAAYIEPKIVTFNATAAIGANKFVKYGASKDLIALCGAGEKAIGVTMSSAAAAGDPVEVALIGGGAKVTAGGTISLGAYVKSDASGDAVAAATDGDYAIGIVTDSAVDNDVVSMIVAPTYIYVAP
jgi:hypothetical protein